MPVVVYVPSAVIRCHRPPLEEIDLTAAFGEHLSADGYHGRATFGVYIIFFDERIFLHLRTAEAGTLSPFGRRAELLPLCPGTSDVDFFRNLNGSSLSMPRYLTVLSP